MRVFLVGLFALIVGLPAVAASPLPKIAKDTPYPTARQQLLAQGFDPVRIIEHGDGLICIRNPAFCRIFPEVLECAGAGAAYCSWLYRSRADGRYWRVSTLGETGTPPQYSRLRYDGALVADASDLAGLVVAGRDGQPVRFAARTWPKAEPPPPPKERPLPLCSRNGGKIPCWIKPPPPEPAHRRP